MREFDNLRPSKPLRRSPPCHVAVPHGRSGEAPPVYTSAGIRAGVRSPASQLETLGRSSSRLENAAASRGFFEPPSRYLGFETLASSSSSKLLKPPPSSVDTEWDKLLAIYEETEIIIQEMQRRRQEGEVRLSHLQSELQRLSSPQGPVACRNFEAGIVSDSVIGADNFTAPALETPTPIESKSGEEQSNLWFHPVAYDDKLISVVDSSVDDHKASDFGAHSPVGKKIGGDKLDFWTESPDCDEEQGKMSFFVQQPTSEVKPIAKLCVSELGTVLEKKHLSMLLCDLNPSCVHGVFLSEMNSLNNGCPVLNDWKFWTVNLISMCIIVDFLAKCDSWDDIGLKLLLYDDCKNSRDCVQYRVDMITFDENSQGFDLCALQPARDDFGGVHSLPDSHLPSKVPDLTSIIYELARNGMFEPVSLGFEPPSQALSFLATSSSIGSFNKVNCENLVGFVPCGAEIIHFDDLSFVILGFEIGCVSWIELEMRLLLYDVCKSCICELLSWSACSVSVIHCVNPEMYKLGDHTVWNCGIELRLLFYDACKNCLSELMLPTGYCLELIIPIIIGPYNFACECVMPPELKSVRVGAQICPVMLYDDNFDNVVEISCLELPNAPVLGRKISSNSLVSLSCLYIESTERQICRKLRLPLGKMSWLHWKFRRGLITLFDEKLFSGPVTNHTAGPFDSIDICVLRVRLGSTHSDKVRHIFSRYDSKPDSISGHMLHSEYPIRECLIMSTGNNTLLVSDATCCYLCQGGLFSVVCDALLKIMGLFCAYEAACYLRSLGQDSSICFRVPEMYKCPLGCAILNFEFDMTNHFIEYYCGLFVKSGTLNLKGSEVGLFLLLYDLSCGLSASAHCGPVTIACTLENCIEPDNGKLVDLANAKCGSVHTLAMDISHEMCVAWLLMHGVLISHPPQKFDITRKLLKEWEDDGGPSRSTFRKSQTWSILVNPGQQTVNTGNLSRDHLSSHLDAYQLRPRSIGKSTKSQLWSTPVNAGQLTGILPGSILRQTMIHDDKG